MCWNTNGYRHLAQGPRLKGQVWPTTCARRATSRYKKASQQLPNISRQLSMAESSRSGHPTGGGRRKHKQPQLLHPIEPPCLPEHLLDGGPSGDEEENVAKRPCSTSTTPKSGKGVDPDEYGRLMGITSVKNPIGGVAKDSATPIDSSGSGIRPGADKDSRGYGRTNLAALAACALQGAGVQSVPRQEARTIIDKRGLQSTWRLQR